MAVAILGLILVTTIVLAVALAAASRGSVRGRRTRWAVRANEPSTFNVSVDGTSSPACSVPDAGGAADCGGGDGGGGGSD